MEKQYKFEWNWKKRLKNWTWYYAVLVIFGPFILAAFFEPDWIARLFGLSFFYIGLPVIGFWYAFGPRKNLGAEGKTIWPTYITMHFGDKAYLGTRIVILIFVGAMLMLLTIPYVKDSVAVIGTNAPLSGEGTVTYIKNTLFISNQIVFNNQPTTIPENKFYALYFPLRYLIQGNTYEFIYLPNTHIILDAKPLSK